MRKKYLKVLGFFSILLLYGSLYLATSYNKCDETCEKLGEVYTDISQTRPYVLALDKCKDTMICLSIKDTILSDWNGFADTACLYLKAHSLSSVRVAVINSVRGDTLVSKKCP